MRPRSRLLWHCQRSALVRSDLCQIRNQLDRRFLLLQGCGEASKGSIKGKNPTNVGLGPCHRCVCCIEWRPDQGSRPPLYLLRLVSLRFGNLGKGLRLPSSCLLASYARLFIRLTTARRIRDKEAADVADYDRECKKRYDFLRWCGVMWSFCAVAGTLRDAPPLLPPHCWYCPFRSVRENCGMSLA